MRKNIRRVPLAISEKIAKVDTDLISVSVPVKVKRSEIDQLLYPNLKLEFNNGALEFLNEYIPDVSSGRFSKRNITGYKGCPLRHLPKVKKEFYAGDRYPFGNDEADTFSLYITREVWQRNEYPPKEWSVVSELIDTRELDCDIIYTLKVGIDQMLDKRSPDFQEQLFFALNLLFENIGNFDVFSSDATIDDYTKTTFVTWEFFPNGTREQIVNRMLSKVRLPTKEIEKIINERAELLRSMNPREYIYGTCLNKQYFGARITENVVVFENIRYGNAIYILFEDWEVISKLSRTNIMQLPARKYIRIPHRHNWQHELMTAVRNFIYKS